MNEPQISNFPADIKKINEKILQQKAVFICGTGVSLAVANNPGDIPLSWTGLLKHGAECAANRTGRDPGEFYDPRSDMNQRLIPITIACQKIQPVFKNYWPGTRKGYSTSMAITYNRNPSCSGKNPIRG
jgi:hypothetical protein